MFGGFHGLEFEGLGCYGLGFKVSGCWNFRVYCVKVIKGV